DGTHLEGTLNLRPLPEPGWSDHTVEDPAGSAQEFRVFTTALGDGLKLSVARDLSLITDAGAAIFEASAWALAATILLAFLGGLFVSSRFLARVDSMTSAAQAIIEGDLKSRLPVRRTRDDLDSLALTLNRMLDRNNELMDSLQQFSNDIA